MEQELLKAGRNTLAFLAACLAQFEHNSPCNELIMAEGAGAFLDSVLKDLYRLRCETQRTPTGMTGHPKRKEVV